jgi:predicted ArsR family transcriptional regulator
LEACGFEPRAEGDRIVLRNCPFEELARAHQTLVCGANLELVRGILQELGRRRESARLEPEPGRCCVVVHGLEALQPGKLVQELSARQS